MQVPGMLSTNESLWLRLLYNQVWLQWILGWITLKALYSCSERHGSFVGDSKATTASHNPTDSKPPTAPGWDEGLQASTIAEKYIIRLGCLSWRLLSQDTCVWMGCVSIYQPLSLVWTSTIYTCTPFSISGFFAHINHINIRQRDL